MDFFNLVKILQKIRDNLISIAVPYQSWKSPDDPWIRLLWYINSNDDKKMRYSSVIIESGHSGADGTWLIQASEPCIGPGPQLDFFFFVIRLLVARGGWPESRAETQRFINKLAAIGCQDNDKFMKASWRCSTSTTTVLPTVALLPSECSITMHVCERRIPGRIHSNHLLLFVEILTNIYVTTHPRYFRL